jgi:hypothetical protein
MKPRSSRTTKARMRWSETVGHQMLDEHGKPTAPVINYIGRPSCEGSGNALLPYFPNRRASSVPRAFAHLTSSRDLPPAP